MVVSGSIALGESEKIVQSPSPDVSVVRHGFSGQGRIWKKRAVFLVETRD
jgi:hypothetical protein